MPSEERRHGGDQESSCPCTAAWSSGAINLHCDRAELVCNSALAQLPHMPSHSFFVEEPLEWVSCGEAVLDGFMRPWTPCI
jgi:hypothetical protein